MPLRCSTLKRKNGSQYVFCTENYKKGKKKGKGKGKVKHLEKSWFHKEILKI